MVRISEIDQELIDLRNELEEGNISKALEFLDNFQEDWKLLKDILDCFKSDIKF